MSPRTGRPPLGDAAKTERIEIRLTKSKAEQLKRCAEKLQVSRAEVIERGIDMVDEKIKK